MSENSTTNEHIKRYGHTVIYVPGEHGRPSFAYTIGLHSTYDAPELLVFGLDFELAKGLLNDVAQKLNNGQRFADGELIEDIANLPFAFKDVLPSVAGFYARQAMFWYEQRGITPSFQQFVVPDRNGNFPWHQGYEPKMKVVQPGLWNA